MLPGRTLVELLLTYSIDYNLTLESPELGFIETRTQVTSSLYSIKLLWLALLQLHGAAENAGGGSEMDSATGDRNAGSCTWCQDCAAMRWRCGHSPCWLAAPCDQHGGLLQSSLRLLRASQLPSLC